MKKGEIKKTVLEVLRSVQGISGRDYVDLKNGDSPIDSLDGFDSLTGIEATVLIEERLGRELKPDSLFVSEDGRRASTLSEICERLEKLVGGREEVAE